MSQPSPELSTVSRGKLTWWMLALLALLAAAVYANSLRNDFAFDDVGIVKNNPHVVDLQWTSIWTDNYWPKVEGVQPDTLYRPLTLWSYLANQAIAPGVAWPFHLVNVLLHSLITVLIAILGWRVLGDRTVAIVAAALFAVHPLHTEVVSNVVGRAELLAAAWSLLMLLVYLPAVPLSQADAPVLSSRIPLIQFALVAVSACVAIAVGAFWNAIALVGIIDGGIVGLTIGLILAAVVGLLFRKQNAPQGLRRWWHGILVALCFTVALLSKETPATLTIAVVFIDAWRWSQWGKSKRPSIWAWFSTQAVRYYAPLALAVALYTKARVNAGGLMARAAVIHHVVNPLVEASPMERLVTPFILLAKYISLTFWPVHLSADYSAPSLQPTANLFTGNSFQPPAIFGVLICVLFVTLSIYFWKRRPQLLLLAGFTFLSYVLVANFVRIGTIFGERLFYWPSVFVLIIVAWGAVEVVRRARTIYAGRLSPLTVSTIATAMLAICVALMGARTWLRNPDWNDNLSLALSTARDNPGSGKACSWAGSILVMEEDPQIREFGKSLIERAIELSPDFVSARWELAKFYGLRGDLGPSAVSVAQAARQDPGTKMTRTAIPALVSDLRTAAPEKYMPYIEEYAQKHPDDEAVYLALSFAYHAQGKWDKAEEMAYKALHTAIPKRGDGADGYHEAGAELAAIRFDRGDVSQAVITMRKYTMNIPHSVEARCLFATMLLALDSKKNPGAVKEAEFNLNIADAITPNNPHVRETRGQLNRYKAAIALGEPIPADIPMPRVTIAAEPKTGITP